MTRPPHREPFLPASDLRDSHVSEMPSWAHKLHHSLVQVQLRQRVHGRDLRAVGKLVSALETGQTEMRLELLGYREESKRSLKVKQHAITVLKNLPLVLGVLSIMFPHLKPIFDAIVKGLGVTP